MGIPTKVECSDQAAGTLRRVEFGGGSDDQLSRALVVVLATRDQALSSQWYRHGFRAARSMQIPGARPCPGDQC